MTVTVQSFRGTYQAFTDPGKYPDYLLQGLLDNAGLLMNACRWGDLLDLGTALRVAHFATLAARDAATAAAGGIPGGVQGVLTDKAVDKVKAGYDVAAVTLKDGGQWNSTSYGIRYLELARMVGTGGLQVGPLDSSQGGVLVGEWPNF